MTFRYSKAPTQRQLQVSESIKKGVSEIISRDSVISSLFNGIFISITEVRISPDLKLATIFFSVLSLDNKNLDCDIESIFNDNINIFRKVLKNYISLKYIPQLRFSKDEILEKADVINKLLSDY